MTPPTTSRRARSPEAKLQRRARILQQAARLFRDRPWDAITMALLARRCRLAKGTLYLYFRTKEEVFLQLLDGELEVWLTEARAILSKAGSPERLGRRMARSIAARPDFARLLSMLPTILEQNLADEVALRFKREMLARIAPLATELESVLPGARSGDGTRLLLWLHAVVVGLFPMANPAPAVARALEQPELAPFRLDFEVELASLMTTLLRGLTQEPKGEKR